MIGTLLTEPEVAERLRVSLACLRRWRRRDADLDFSRSDLASGILRKHWIGGSKPCLWAGPYPVAQSRVTRAVLLHSENDANIFNSGREAIGTDAARELTMSVFRPSFKDPKTGERKSAAIWWYKFYFAGQCIRESAKTTSKTLAKQAEQNRRRELEEGFNGVADRREERVRTIKTLADEYLEAYKLRAKSGTFATYALNHITRLLGKQMAVEVTEKAIKDYQTARLKEKAAPKTINEEVGFLLRLLGEQGDAVRTRLRRQKALKLRAASDIGKAYSAEEKGSLYDEAKKRRSKAIYPALVLTLNCGLRDKELRQLQWGRIHLREAYLAVGESKTDAGSGRTVPLNAFALEVLKRYADWYEEKFKALKPEWFVFPAGKPQPTDPTKPCTSFKTVWRKIKADAGVTGRWHDNRHTFITGLAESGAASDQTIMDIAGHVSKRMLKHYSHIRMEAKRRAVAALVTTKPDTSSTPDDIQDAKKMAPRVAS